MSELESIRGVGPSTARKLADAGLTTVASVAAAESARLVELTGFGLPRVAVIQAAARAAQAPGVDLADSSEDPEESAAATKPPRKVRKLQKRAHKLRAKAAKARAKGKLRRAKKAEQAAEKADEKASKKLKRSGQA